MRYEARASSGIKVLLHQHEFDALVSLAYNTWSALGNDSNIVKKLNAGLYHAVPDELIKYDKIKEKGTGRIIPSNGLRIRRLAEMDIFKHANYSMHA